MSALSESSPDGARPGDARREGDATGGASHPGLFRRTLARVLAVQAVTLLLLWLLQALYAR
ncbi:MAG: hypothetical protein ACE5PT_03095 [Gemmatimonadales bacterium]